MAYTNATNISPLMAVWLLHDSYDMVPAEKKLSVTTLLKSPRQVILGSRLKEGDANTDIFQLIPARLGQSIHAGIEQAWQSPQDALRALGYPAKLVNAAVVNPTEWGKDDFPIWIELRTEKECIGWTISGCADAIMNNAVHDVKSTGCFAFTSGSNNTKYRQQLSMYRWLNPDKVTSEQGYIEYYFKDWDKLTASYKPNYPQSPILQQPIPLMSLPETERFIKEKILQIEFFWNKDESELPLCSSDDLWQGKAQWQYFGKSDAQKASKNFDTEPEAIQWRNAKGKGEVRYKPAKAKACTYCDARPLCSQYQSLHQRGLI